MLPISFAQQASVSEQPVLFASSCFTIISFLMQIFLMCFFGQQTMSEYDLLLHQLYSSDWPEMIFKLKKNQLQNVQNIFTFFMQNLKKDTQILVGKVFPLSLSTFTSVCALTILLIFIEGYFISTMWFWISF